MPSWTGFCVWCRIAFIIIPCHPPTPFLNQRHLPSPDYEPLGFIALHLNTQRTLVGATCPLWCLGSLRPPPWRGRVWAACLRAQLSPSLPSARTAQLVSAPSGTEPWDDCGSRSYLTAVSGEISSKHCLAQHVAQREFCRAVGQDSR